MEFRRDRFERFRLTGFDAHPETRSVVLRYSLDDTYHFEEHARFVGDVAGDDDCRRPTELSPGARVGFRRAVRLLHLAAGVSYYKAAAPRRIVVETGRLTPTEMQLFHDLYDRGLREFAYRNGLEIPRDLDIQSEAGPAVPSDSPDSTDSPDSSDPPPGGVAVPIGGGKDSIVVLEALRDIRPVLVSVNPNPASRRIAQVAGRDLVAVRRTLDPLLFDLNQLGALNGHVPVTAIVSLITVAGGYLFGYDTTAMALEGSADAPTRVVRGRSSAKRNGHGPTAPAGGATNRAIGLPDHDVNHQWSKSAEFELQLQQVLRESVHPAIRYLSPLRSFSELEITNAFATLMPYHQAFRSCNGVARLAVASDRWCCDCPKCRFVFLALATALDRQRVVSIFGADLLDDITQLEGFSDLLDQETKPFECVGTVDEVRAAMTRLLADPQWRGASVLEQLRHRPPEHGFSPAASHRSATPSEVFSTVRDALSETSIK